MSQIMTAEILERFFCEITILCKMYFAFNTVTSLVY